MCIFIIGWIMSFPSLISLFFFCRLGCWLGYWLRCWLGCWFGYWLRCWLGCWFGYWLRCWLGCREIYLNNGIAWAYLHALAA